MNWEADRGLQVRMAVLIIALVVLYAVFLSAIAVYMNSFLLASLFVGLVVFAQFWFGSNLALKLTDAQVVTPEEYPELHNRVTRLSQQAGMSVPTVAVSSSRTPNAFASGRSESDAVVCVTKGLLDTLDGEELDAVIAHELAHIKHRDVAIMMVASTISAIALFIIRWGWLADDSGNASVLVAILVSFFVWIASYVLIRILSQQREYTADRGGVAITGKPMALAMALKKISDSMDDVPEEDLRTSSSMNAMNFYEVEMQSRMTKWFSTHPAVEDRVEQLQELEAEMV